MDSSHDSSSSDERETSVDTNGDKKIYHRHTNEQIQRLEAYFKECPHPDDVQRRKLGEELSLRPKQIKFWFQNKRTQAKAQSEKADNTALRQENIRIKCENDAMAEAIKTVLCPPCGGPLFGREERELRLQNLRAQNAYLKRELEKLAIYRNPNGGPSVPGVGVDSLAALPGPSSHAPISDNPQVAYGTSSNQQVEPLSLVPSPYIAEDINIAQPPRPRQLQNYQSQSQMETMMLAEMAMNAVAEVTRLIQFEEPMWIKSSIDGRLVIDQDNYEKLFTKINHFKNPSARIESSKEVVVVPMDAISLVDMFLDAEKWGMMFATIVNEAKTIQVLESVDPQRQNVSKLMYEQLHILSPLVPPREFMILRTCQRVEEGLWVIADVSCHHINFEFEFTTPTCSKRPSGFLIQALPNARSKVTWMEHVEVNDKVRTHRLYRDLLCGGFGYGARRWTATLQRMCERLSLTSISVFPATDHAGVVKTIEGRRSVMKLGERMLKNFAWALKMSGKFDFSQLSETNSSGVRVSVRINEDPGQPLGLIVCAGSSLCLPVSPLQIYHFLRNVDVRHQWDVLCHGNDVSELARFVTGTNSENCVNFIQPSTTTENGDMMIIQDGFIDALGGMVVYAPVDLNTAYTIVSGNTDPSGIAVLPSGFIISRDGRPSAAELDGGPENSATILTVAFQILVCGQALTGDLRMEESTATVNTLISSTIQRIKGMLNCDEGRQ
ncbi:unnamed protein product [Thlaspi arvense]|uniref:Uncharacterized protein n=1 Tax=Thlaspi arvense TaxID=13288 RepID=A0AAU9SVG2_THLAR|nr:unnamed protein product [Thlaspi arvense]